MVALVGLIEVATRKSKSSVKLYRPAGAPLSMDGSGAKAMDRAEFVERVFSWAARRYGLKLTEAWINDLIKDQLVPEGIRQANYGLSPTYGYDRLSYRRALQIARLRRGGFIRRDAVRIQLFLRGYSMQAQEIRSALLTEYVNHSRSLLAQVRSRYIDNSKPIPKKHKQSLAQSLGPIDDRLFAADFELDPDTYIEMVRKAKQEPLNFQNAGSPQEHLPKLTSDGLAFSNFATDMIGTLAGLLMLDPAPEDEQSEPDYIEAIIRRSDRRRYEQAREFYRVITSRCFADVAGVVETDGDPEGRRKAFAAISSAVKGDSRWAALLLVLGLKFANQSQMSVSADEIREGLRAAKEQGLNLRNLLLTAIGNQEK
jgi:hypothetical protein